MTIKCFFLSRAEKINMSSVVVNIRQYNYVSLCIIGMESCLTTTNEENPLVNNYLVIKVLLNIDF